MAMNNTMLVGILLLALGVVLALATTIDDFGWLMAVAGIVLIVIAAILPYMRRR
jgi:hypothetical protein